MAFSAVFFPSCIPRTQSSLLSATKPPSLESPTTLVSSLFPPAAQAPQKFQYQPLRMSPIVANPKRCVGKVKASKRYPSVEVFSQEHLAVSLAYDVVELSKKFIQDRGYFSIALSCGSPIKYLRRLFEPPHIGSIDWSKWHFVWMEPMDDDAEGEKQEGGDTFLSKVLGFRTNVSSLFSCWKVPPPRHHLNVYNIPDVPAQSFETYLQIWMAQKFIASSESSPDDQIPKFDLILLGVDPDGHVASPLIPDHPAPDENRGWVTPVNDPEDPTRQRLAFTLPVVTSSSNVAVVVSGAGKANAVYSALRDDEEGETTKLVSGEAEVKWYLDKGAASKLFKEEIHVEGRNAVD